MDTMTITANDVRVGDVINFPHQTSTGIEHRRVTVSYILEYPENRVLYFAEGALGVADRRAQISRWA